MAAQGGRGGNPRPVPTSTTLWKDITYLATFSEELGDIRDAAIFVRGNAIEWVGEASAIPSQYKAADVVVSGRDRVVIPGLVNTHHHM